MGVFGILLEGIEELNTAEAYLDPLRDSPSKRIRNSVVKKKNGCFFDHL